MSATERTRHHRTHSRRRASERFDLKLTRNARAILKAIIASGEAEYVGIGNLRRPMFKVPLDRVGKVGLVAVVVCEEGTSDPVTLMPATWRQYR